LINTDNKKVFFGNGDYFIIFVDEKPITNGNYKNICNTCPDNDLICSFEKLEQCILESYKEYLG